MTFISVLRRATQRAAAALQCMEIGAFLADDHLRPILVDGRLAVRVVKVRTVRQWRLHKAKCCRQALNLHLVPPRSAAN